MSIATTMSIVDFENHLVLTLTSDQDLDIPLEMTPPQPKSVGWESLGLAGILDAYRLDDAGAAAFGLPSGAFIEVFAFISLVDPELSLYEVRKAAHEPVIGWAVLSECYTDLIDWIGLPDGITL